VGDAVAGLVEAAVESIRRKGRRPKVPRDPSDRYWTPVGYTRALLARVPIAGVVLEPSAGEGAIVRALIDHGRPAVREIVTRDILPGDYVSKVADMTGASAWAETCDPWLPGIDWVVMNPPFNHAARFVELALERAAVGVAALVRLSFLEPVKGREAALVSRPPDRVIVLPRVKFRGKGSDSVTCAWCVWGRFVRPGVDVVPRAELQA
jgi:hypothetical protein